MYVCMLTCTPPKLSRQRPLSIWEIFSPGFSLCLLSKKCSSVYAFFSPIRDSGFILSMGIRLFKLPPVDFFVHPLSFCSQAYAPCKKRRILAALFSWLSRKMIIKLYTMVLPLLTTWVSLLKTSIAHTYMYWAVLCLNRRKIFTNRCEISQIS